MKCKVNKAVDWIILHEVEVSFVSLKEVERITHLLQTYQQNENINSGKERLS